MLGNGPHPPPLTRRSPFPQGKVWERDKLKFEPRFGVERRGAAIRRMQCVTHWLSAHADKLKFAYMIFCPWEIILLKRRWMKWMNLIVR